MDDIVRISAPKTREKVQSGAALLVCAYDNEEKFRSLHLDGALSLNEFQDKSSSLSKDKEIIFYCA